MNWISLLLPLAYLTVLVGTLATFSSLYRRRQALKASNLQPWFPPHLQRNIYHSLLELQSTSTQKIPDSILKAALFRRATEDIHRLIALRTQKPALAQLLQRGSVGDELWQRFQIAEKEMEEELKDVVAEANALAPGPTTSGNQQQQQPGAGGWGQTIFQSASETAHRDGLTKKLREIEDRREVEKEDWQRRTDGVRDGFMKELEGGEKENEKKDKDAGKKTGSSDEEVVLVEGVGSDTPGADSTPGTGGKKKKGKK